MAKLNDKKPRAKRKALEFGGRYGSVNCGIQAKSLSPIAMQIAAHSLFQNEEHREMMALIANHWKDSEARFDATELAIYDARELELLCIARAMYVYRMEDGFMELTAEGKEALANYKATTDEPKGME